MMADLVYENGAKHRGAGSGSAYGKLYYKDNESSIKNANNTSGYNSSLIARRVVERIFI